MLKKIVILLVGVFMFCSSSAVLADTCLPQYKGLNFINAATSSNSRAGICQYSVAVVYLVPVMQPLSGPWIRNPGPGQPSYQCQGAASVCVFSTQ